MGYYMPGLGYQENYLPFCQADLGNSVHILTGERYAPHVQYETVYAPRLGPRFVGTGEQTERRVQIHRLPVLFENQKRQNLWLKGLIKKLTNLNPDIIHLHGVTPFTTLQVLCAKLPREITLICDHHICAFNLSPFTLAKKIYYAGFKYVLLKLLKNRVGGWLPINRDAQQVLDKMLGISGQKVWINALGVETELFRVDPAIGQSWRERHNISDKTPLIIHAGRIEPRKKVEHLIAAMAHLPNPVQLVIAGDGPAAYMAKLQALIQKLALTSRVSILPIQPHDELAYLFNAANLAVWPGDPAITTIEAMGCGVPIVMADIPGRNYIGDLPITTYANDDISELARAIEETLKTNSDNKIALSQLVKKSRDWNAIAAASIEIYRQAMATK